MERMENKKSQKHQRKCFTKVVRWKEKKGRNEAHQSKKSTRKEGK